MRRLSRVKFLAIWALTVSAVCGLSPSAQSQTVIDDFNPPWGFTDQYGWDMPFITQTPDSIIVNATNDGGFWVDLPAVIDGSTQSTLELTARLGSSNTTTGFNAVFFDNNGTQAGFSFPTASLNSSTFTTLTKNFLTPDFFNAGTIGTWTPANVTTYHLQGNFDPFGAGIIANIEFGNLQLAVPEPTAIALFGMALIGMGPLFGRYRRS